MGEKVITTWGPDTCGCSINYSWDRDSSENSRVHVYEGHNKRCQDHEHLIEEPLYNAVVEENQRKNILLQHAVDAHKTKLADVIKKGDKKSTHWKISRPGFMIGPNGEEPIDERNVIFVLSDDVEFRFFFTGRAPDRVLNVTFSEPLTDAEKALIEARFPDRVKVL